MGITELTAVSSEQCPENFRTMRRPGITLPEMVLQGGLRNSIIERMKDMKIILLQDEKKLGKKGDIIEASDGYARNYILPKKIGVEANAKNMNDLKLQKANNEKIAQEQLDAARALAKDLEPRQVVVKIKAGEGGKTFGSVSSKEIAAALKEQHGIELDKKKIQLGESLKSFGNYEVSVKLHPQVTGKFTVKVTEA